MSNRSLQLSSLKSCPVDCGGKLINAPVFLAEAFNVINQHITTVGIFRTGGNAKRVKEMKGAFFGDESIRDNVTVSDICAGVKSFLRDLDEPLLSSALEIQFLQCASTLSREDVRIRAILQLCRALSIHHRETLAFLMWHLKKVANSCHLNKMTVNNLAVVIALSVFRCNELRVHGKVLDALQVTRLKVSVIELLIEHAEDICAIAKRSELLPSDKHRNGLRSVAGRCNDVTVLHL